MTAVPKILLAAIVFVLLPLPLLLVLVQAALPGLFNLDGPDWSLSFAALTELATSPRLAGGVLNSALLGVAGAVTSTLLGTGLALLFGLTDLRHRPWFEALPWIVFATPSFFKGLSWVLLMLPGGYLVQLHILTPDQARSFFGLAGLIFVETIGLFPVPYFIVRARLEGLGGEYVDAARMASAGPWRILRLILLPMLASAIGLSLLTTFAEIVSDFGMASTIAKQMNFGLLTYNIYSATSQYPVDFPAAAAQSLTLGLLVGAVVVAGRASGAQDNLRFLTGRNRVFSRFKLGVWQGPMVAILALLSFAAAILPLIAVSMRAFTVTLADGLRADNVSLAAFAKIFDSQSRAGQSFIDSFGYSLATGVAATILGFFIALPVAGGRPWLKSLASWLALLTVALPGIVLGFGYILLYARVPGFAGLNLYGGPWLLIVAYVAAALPYALMFLWTALDRLGASLQDAARVAGASSMRRLSHVVAPLVRQAVLTVFGVSVLRTLFELPLSRLLIPIKGPPLPVVVVENFTQDRDALACAVALLAMAVVGAVAAVAVLALRGRAPTGMAPA